MDGIGITHWHPYQCIRTTAHSPNRVSDTLGKRATHTIEERHIRVFSPFGVSTIAKCDTSEWGSFATPQRLCLQASRMNSEVGIPAQAALCAKFLFST
jgi:hypothetical protein